MLEGVLYLLLIGTRHSWQSPYLAVPVSTCYRILHFHQPALVYHFMDALCMMLMADSNTDTITAILFTLEVEEDCAVRQPLKQLDAHPLRQDEKQN